MKYAKSKRIVDRKLLDSYQGIPCIICNVSHGTCAHHIKTKKTGGHDIDINLVALCHKHHLEIHQHGTEYFALKYSSFLMHLLKNKWERIVRPDGSHKWVNSQAC